jgi:hypothetical protein
VVVITASGAEHYDFTKSQGVDTNLYALHALYFILIYSELLVSTSKMHVGHARI